MIYKLNKDAAYCSAEMIAEPGISLFDKYDTKNGQLEMRLKSAVILVKSDQYDDLNKVDLFEIIRKGDLLADENSSKWDTWSLWSSNYEDNCVYLKNSIFDFYSMKNGMAIIKNKNSGDYFVLEEPGFFLWNMMSEEKSISDIIKEMKNRYREKEVIGEDVFVITDVLLRSFFRNDILLPVEAS